MIAYQILVRVGWKSGYGLMLLNFFLTEGKGMLFLFVTRHQPASLNSVQMLEEEATMGNIMLIAFAIIVHISFEVQFSLGVFIFGTASVTTWMATRNFTKSVMNPAKIGESQFFQGNRKEILRQIQINLAELIKLANAVNSAYNEICFWFVLSTSIFMSKEFDQLITVSEFSWKLLLAILILSLGVGMVLSAECSRKVIICVLKIHNLINEILKS